MAKAIIIIINYVHFDQWANNIDSAVSDIHDGIKQIALTASKYS